MTIYKTAYETKACEGFGRITDKIALGLRKAQISYSITEGGAVEFKNLPIYTLEAANSADSAVDAFAHPFYVPATKDNPEILAVDLRSFGRWDDHQHVFNVRGSAQADVALLRMRAILNHFWIHESPEILRDTAPHGARLYADFISKSVKGRLGLDAQEEHDLAILSMIFYYSLFTNEEYFSEAEEMRIVQAIVRNLVSSSEMVYAVIDRINEGGGRLKVIPGIKEFCLYAQMATQSVRLEGFNVGSLLMILSGGWYGGINAGELVAVAIEHPPTWLAVLLTAAEARTFGKTRIAELFMRSNSQAQRQFRTAMATLLGNYVAQINTSAAKGEGYASL